MNYDVLIPYETYKKLNTNLKGTVITFNKVFQTKDKNNNPLKIRHITERVKAKLVKANGQPIFGNALYDIVDNKIVGVFPA